MRASPEGGRQGEPCFTVLLECNHGRPLWRTFPLSRLYTGGGKPRCTCCTPSKQYFFSQRRRRFFLEMTPFASRTSAMCVAWLAIFKRGEARSSSTAVLAFARPARRVFLGQPPTRECSHLNVRSESSKRRHHHQHAAPLCTLPREALWPQHDHDRPPLLLLSTMTDRRSQHASTASPHRRIRRRGFATAMNSKDGDAPTIPPAATVAARTEEPTTNGAEIAAGMRVRLRDTGRLGTVVGKKAGGWWVVDLLESWGGTERDTAATGASSGRSGNGHDEGGAGGHGASNRTESGAASSSGPISTRRLNMEPLGSAYASSSEDISAAVTATAAPSAAAAKNKRRHSTLKGSGRTNGDSTAATAAAIDIAKGTAATTAVTAAVTAAVAEAAAAAPPSLLGQPLLPATPVEEGAVAIHAMSAEGLAHAEMKEWMVFSDLHVSPSSLDVTLQVLDRVNTEAMKRPACGIAFLGDFWHARGSLKVDLLVPIMNRLATWTRPVVMIPGNHDQVTLGGGMHALTPLQFAFADPKQALVLSEPTLFLNALWIPHRRNNEAMTTLLGSEEARGARAIFCHVDIRGASMNDGVSSHSGIPRSAFPDGVPTFSGHFHKPHTIGDGFIRYVGSPYQTCLAESGQSKSLVVLDSEAWEEKATIPLDVGRRFFRVKGEDQPLPDFGEASPGDRVVWTVEDAGSEDVRRRAEALQKEMVEVEIRETPKRPPFSTPGLLGPGLGAGGGDVVTGNETTSASTVDGMAAAAAATAATSGFPDSASLSPDALFRAYLEREREGGRNISEKVERLGFTLIEDLGQQVASKFNASCAFLAPKESGMRDRHTSLALHSIQLKNFGPFREEVTYPLDGRGVVLLRGSNLDDSGADSNGSGKTTLAMSALWAMAGVVDARPVSDGRVADVVHEGTRALPPSSSSLLASSDGKGAEKAGAGGARRPAVAEATLTGTLNGKPLWLKRRKGSRVNQLFLKHDGKDLTRQIAKETQIVLEEELGLSPHVLGRGIFQGQHHINGLLESTDAQLKEDLALLVPMDMWQGLASRSRAMARNSDEDAARFRER
ncbi:unnamed protein product, partial [Laminaria digitata]